MPVHIGQILSVQIPNIPPFHGRIIKQSHREGVGLYPYTLETVRHFVKIMGGNDKIFDQSVKELVAIRRQNLLSLSQSRDLELGQIVTVSFNQYTKTPANTYNLYSQPGPSGVIPYLISPFLEESEVREMLPRMQEISGILTDASISLPQKDEAWKSYLVYLAQKDNFLSQWGYFDLTCEFPDSEGIRASYLSVYNAFLEAYAHLSSRYSLKGKLVFPRVPTRFADLLLIPSGTFLYRGYADNYSKNGFSIQRTFDYFAFDFFTSSFYAGSDECCATIEEWLAQDSGIAVFKTNQVVRVLDLTSAGTVAYMRDQMEIYGAPQNVQDAFKFAWKITPAGKIRRNSGPKSDNLIVDWICSMGWDGYIGIGIDGLHDEILLCQPQEVLELYKDLKHSKDFLNDFATIEADSIKREAIIVEY